MALLSLTASARPDPARALDPALLLDQSATWRSCRVASRRSGDARGGRGDRAHLRPRPADPRAVPEVSRATSYRGARHEHHLAPSGDGGDRAALSRRPSSSRSRQWSSPSPWACLSGSSRQSATAASSTTASLVTSLIGDLVSRVLPRDPAQVPVLRELGWLPTIGRQDVLISADHPTGFYVLDGIVTLNFEAAWDAALHLVLPAIALGSIPLAIVARITRAAVLDVQNEDYVRTARAKGCQLASRRQPPHLPQRDASRRHDHRTADGSASLRRDPDGNGVCHPRAWGRGSPKRSATATIRFSRAASSSSRSCSCS